MYLILNAGSSSLKYKLFSDDMSEIKSSRFTSIGSKIRDHNQALDLLFDEVKEHLSEIKFIGHRIVHGGAEADPVMPVDLKSMEIISKYAELAPHHNPSAEKVIRASIELFPNSQHFVAFDTAFYRNLPDVARTYPIDKNIAEEYKIYRYGFHGISHQYLAKMVDPENMKKVVSLHLGAGASVTAILNGKPIDTTMGFTPIDGIPMQTRSGEIDPEIVLYLVGKIGLAKTQTIIEQKSGLAGISGTSGEMLTLLSLAELKVEDPDFDIASDQTAKNSNKELASLALDIYCYKIKKIVAGYIAVLGGIDAIAFTGEIGFGSEVIRKKILSGLNFVDFQIEKVKPEEELAIGQLIKDYLNL